jgi:hypothetical protein
MTTPAPTEFADVGDIPIYLDEAYMISIYLRAILFFLSFLRLHGVHQHSTCCRALPPLPCIVSIAPNNGTSCLLFTLPAQKRWPLVGDGSFFETSFVEHTLLHVKIYFDLQTFFFLCSVKNFWMDC